ncbi:uncharacterized [Tachysurus ichikawai]
MKHLHFLDVSQIFRDRELLKKKVRKKRKKEKVKEKVKEKLPQLGWIQQKGTVKPRGESADLRPPHPAYGCERNQMNGSTNVNA